jgi:hypothetical protein
VDVCLTVHDNGDNRVCLEVLVGEKKTINVLTDMYVPPNHSEVEGSRVMVGATGHTVLVREVKAKLVQREETFKVGLVDS